MKKSYFKYIFSMLLFGSNGIIANNIGLSSYEIVFWRTLIGSFFLAVLFFATKQKLSFHKHLTDTAFIALSGISMGASWMFLYEAYTQIGVSLASLSYYCGPVIVMILSPLLFKEKLTFTKIFSFLAVAFGIVLVNGSLTDSRTNVWGVFCGLMSALTYSFMVIFNKKSQAVGGLENSVIQLIFGFLTVSVFLGIKTGYQMSIAAGDWVWILLLGFINTGFGCYLYFSSIGKLPVQTVAICGYLEALSAVVLSALILSESLSPLQIVGAIFIMGGAIFGECSNEIGQEK